MAYNGTFFKNYTDYLWDHITCSSNNDRITNTHIFSLCFTKIMQSCITYRRSTYKNGFKTSYWRQSSCPTYLKLYIPDLGQLFLGRKFMR